MVAAEVAKILRPVAKPLVIERRQAVRHSGGRRQRLGQDHDDRQARREVLGRRPQGGARRRRHLPRRRHRSAQDLGRPHRRQGRRPRAGLRLREPGLRGAERGEGRGRRRADRRHRRPVAEPRRADGRAGKDGSGDEEARSRRAARRAAGARRHRRPERAVAGRGVRQNRRRHRPGDDQARRHRARRHPGFHRREIQAADPFHRCRRRRRRPSAVAQDFAGGGVERFSRTGARRGSESTSIGLRPSAGPE